MGKRKQLSHSYDSCLKGSGTGGENGLGHSAGTSWLWDVWWERPRGLCRDVSASVTWRPSTFQGEKLRLWLTCSTLLLGLYLRSILKVHADPGSNCTIQGREYRPCVLTFNTKASGRKPPQSSIPVPGWVCHLEAVLSVLTVMKGNCIQSV